MAEIPSLYRMDRVGPPNPRVARDFAWNGPQVELGRALQADGNAKNRDNRLLEGRGGR